MSVPEGLCLRYPESLAPQPTLSQEMAISMLSRATQLAQHTPFVWSYIDKPNGEQFMRSCMSVRDHSRRFTLTSRRGAGVSDIHHVAAAVST